MVGIQFLEGATGPLPPFHALICSRQGRPFRSSSLNDLSCRNHGWLADAAVPRGRLCGSQRRIAVTVLGIQAFCCNSWRDDAATFLFEGRAHFRIRLLDRGYQPTQAHTRLSSSTTTAQTLSGRREAVHVRPSQVLEELAFRPIEAPARNSPPSVSALS